MKRLLARLRRRRFVNVRDLRPGDRIRIGYGVFRVADPPVVQSAYWPDEFKVSVVCGGNGGCYFGMWDHEKVEVVR